MGGHGRHAGALDDDVTARAPNCHSCLLRRLPSAGADSRPAQAMMTRRGPGLSPVPKARSDTPCQTRFDHRSRAAPGLSRAVLFPFRGPLRPRHGRGSPQLQPFASFRGVPGKVAQAPPYAFSPVLFVLSLPSGPGLVPKCLVVALGSYGTEHNLAPSRSMCVN